MKSEAVVLDRQQLEAILSHRFPGAALAQIAAAANAIMALASAAVGDGAPRPDGPPQAGSEIDTTVPPPGASSIAI